MIKIWASGNRVSFYGPKLESFNKEARKLGGKFQHFSRTWLFEGKPGMEGMVRKLAKQFYGSDYELNNVSVEIVISHSHTHGHSKNTTHLLDQSRHDKTICGRNPKGWTAKKEYGSIDQFVSCKSCIQILSRHGLQPKPIPKHK